MGIDISQSSADIKTKLFQLSVPYPHLTFFFSLDNFLSQLSRSFKLFEPSNFVFVFKVLFDTLLDLINSIFLLDKNEASWVS